LAEEALAMCRRIFSGDHPCIATGLANLASSLVMLDRASEALPLYEEALAMSARVWPANHARIHITQIGKGAALVAIGQYAEARAVLVPAWDAVAERPDVPRKHKVRCLEGLIELLDAMRAAEPAVGHQEQANVYRAALQSLK
jgi:hypothetical protein